MQVCVQTNETETLIEGYMILPQFRKKATKFIREELSKILLSDEIQDVIMMYTRSRRETTRTEAEENSEEEEEKQMIVESEEEKSVEEEQPQRLNALFPKATAHETIIKKAADSIFIEKEAPKVEAFEQNQLCPTIIQEIDEEMSEIKKQKHSAPRESAEFLHLSDSPIQIQIKQFG